MGKISELTESIKGEKIKDDLKNLADRDALSRLESNIKNTEHNNSLTTSTHSDKFDQNESQSEEEKKDDSISRKYKKFHEIEEKRQKEQEEKAERARKNAQIQEKQAEEQRQQEETNRQSFKEQTDDEISEKNDRFVNRDEEKLKELNTREDQERRRLEKTENEKQIKVKDGQRGKESDDTGTVRSKKIYNQHQTEEPKTKIKEEELEIKGLKKQVDIKDSDKIKTADSKLEKIGGRGTKADTSHRLDKIRGVNSGSKGAKAKQAEGTAVKFTGKKAAVSGASGASAGAGAGAAGAGSAGASAGAAGAGVAATPIGWIALIIIGIIFILVIIVVLIGAISSSMGKNPVSSNVNTTGYDSENAQEVYAYLYEVFDGNDIAVCGIMGNLYVESASKMCGNQLEDGMQSLFGLPSGDEGDTKYTEGMDSGKYVGHPYFEKGGAGAKQTLEYKISHDFGYFVEGEGYRLYPPSGVPDRYLGAGYGICQYTYGMYKEDILKLSKHKDWKCSVSDTKMQLYYMVGTKKSAEVKELGKTCAYGTERINILKAIKEKDHSSIDDALDFATAIALTWERGYSATDYIKCKNSETSYSSRYNATLAFYALYAGGGGDITNFVNSGDFAEMNGTYFYQQGSGPCEMCSVMNMIKRYCYACGDDKWNQFTPDMKMNGGDGRDTFYKTVAETPGVGDSKYKGSHIICKPKGSSKEIISKSDLGWGVRQPGSPVKIHDINCQWTQVNEVMSKSKLLTLLKSHPEGIVVWKAYSGGGHAKIAVGYDSKQDQFLVLDPGTHDASGASPMFIGSSVCWQTVDGAAFYWKMEHLKQTVKKDKKDDKKDDKKKKDEK